MLLQPLITITLTTVVAQPLANYLRIPTSNPTNQEQQRFFMTTQVTTNTNMVNISITIMNAIKKIKFKWADINLHTYNIKLLTLACITLTFNQII